MASDLLLLTEGPLIAADELETVTGWALKPEGLCRDDRCVLVPDRAALMTDDSVNALAFAELLDRPAVTDEPSGVTAIGAERSVRRLALDDLVAPDFVLPDTDGTPHALSDHRGKKRLLVAFSTW